MPIGDAEVWWNTLHDVKCKGIEPTKIEFMEQFKQAYVPQVAKERRMREVLELTHREKTLEEYVA